MSKPERVQNAPGLVWKKRNNGKWEARWQCRTDILARGYHVKSMKLWSGTGEPSLDDWDFIAETSKSLQRDMLAWSHGDERRPVVFDKRTLGSLMACYQTDRASDYHKLRHASRVHYDNMIRLIKKDHGEALLADINARELKIWYDEWTKGGKISSGHARIAQMRIVMGFGMTMLEDRECERISVVLSKMKFKQAPAREAVLTADQVIAVRKMAHEMGRPSIALAQAIQFECMLRQKDVIGEYVPMKEPVVSDTFRKGLKWARGLRWEEISSKLILTHITSKKGKKLVVNLHNAPMVLEEFEHVKRQYGGELPANGPIIRNEFDGHPWRATEFRRWWRGIADRCGVPRSIRNMDTRAGAITEATEAGANIEHVKHAATHSDISMTQRYSRNDEAKIVQVQKVRLEGRGRTRTSDD